MCVCVCAHLCVINDRTIKNHLLHRRLLSLPHLPLLPPPTCPLLSDGCPNLCNGNGQCTMGQQSWHCECQTGWRGPGCSVAMETSCADNKDNEGGEMRGEAGNVEQGSIYIKSTPEAFTH